MTLDLVTILFIVVVASIILYQWYCMYTSKENFYYSPYSYGWGGWNRSYYPYRSWYGGGYSRGWYYPLWW